MHENCERARAVFEQKFPDAELFDYSRHTVLALDSMHVKGCFGVSRNANELVAIDTSEFEELVILNELE